MQEPNLKFIDSAKLQVLSLHPARGGSICEGESICGKTNIPSGSAATNKAFSSFLPKKGNHTKVMRRWEEKIGVGGGEEEEEAVPSRPKFGAEEELSITSLYVVAFPPALFPWADWAPDGRGRTTRGGPKKRVKMQLGTTN